MQASIVTKKLSILKGNEVGVTLIETLLALAILGIVAVSFLSGLSTTFRAVAVSQERTVAESLAKSQLEHIKMQNYIPVAEYDPNNPEKCYGLIDIPDNLLEQGYDIEASSPETVVVSGGGAELQSITVVIRRNGEEMLTILDYKRDL